MALGSFKSFVDRSRKQFSGNACLEPRGDQSKDLSKAPKSLRHLPRIEDDADLLGSQGVSFCVLPRWIIRSSTYCGSNEHLVKLNVDAIGIICDCIHCALGKNMCWTRQ